MEMTRFFSACVTIKRRPPFHYLFYIPHTKRASKISCYNFVCAAPGDVSLFHRTAQNSFVSPAFSRSLTSSFTHPSRGRGDLFRRIQCYN